MHALENSKVSNTVTCDDFSAKKPEDNTNLNFIRKGNFNRLVLAHININSIRNKFDILVQQIINNVDVLMISETKLDNSFPGLFIKPGIQERGTERGECGERGEYSPGFRGIP